MSALAWPFVALVFLALWFVAFERWLAVRRAELEQRKRDATVAERFADLEAKVAKYRDDVNGLKSVQAMKRGI